MSIIYLATLNIQWCQIGTNHKGGLKLLRDSNKTINKVSDRNANSLTSLLEQKGKQSLAQES